MPNNEELIQLNENLLAAHSNVEKAMREAEKAKRAEERAIQNYENFIRKAFLTQMKEFLGGAPVLMDVFYNNERKLPPEDEPDKYGCRFIITAFKKRVYVSGEYASVNPIEEDFFDVYNGFPPMQKNLCWVGTICVQHSFHAEEHDKKVGSKTVRSDTQVQNYA